MLSMQVLPCVEDLSREFSRCCKEYKALDMATAWFGDPDQVFPYDDLRRIPQGKIRVTLGTSFSQTHPGSIGFLNDLKADVRIFRENKGLFHPKVYIFTKGPKVAAIIGSSNFTYSGFKNNYEINVLFEGYPATADQPKLRQLKKVLQDWHSPQYSFRPSPQWLKAYTKSFEAARRKERASRLRTAPSHEADIGSAGWLGKADWSTYYDQVVAGIKRRDPRHSGNPYKIPLTLPACFCHCRGNYRTLMIVRNDD